MKSKSLELSDYVEISENVRALFREEARFRGAGYTFDIQHPHRYWEYGSAAKALTDAGIEPPARVLDVGCGHGPLGPWLAKLSYRVNEIDPSPQVANRGDLRPALEGCDWAFSTSPLVDFKPGTPYDAVFAISVMEHIPDADQPAAWAKLASLVAPGGLLFVTVDYGRADAANSHAREIIFDRPGLERVLAELEVNGVDVEDYDLDYHGDQVFNYTFFRIYGRKVK